MPEHAAHTPGPWTIEMPVPPSATAWIWDRPPLRNEEFDSGQRRILITPFVVSGESSAANLRLIAAAPDLLAACQAAWEQLRAIAQDDRSEHALRYPVLDQLRAAIAQAGPIPVVTLALQDNLTPTLEDAHDALKQLLTDPENQPAQFGMVPQADDRPLVLKYCRYCGNGGYFEQDEEPVCPSCRKAEAAR